MIKKIIKPIVIVLSIVLLFIAYRGVFCPKMLQMENTDFSNEEKEMMSAIIDSNLISIMELAENVSNKKIILAGEIHFQEKVMQNFIGFLDLLPEKGFTLALELPNSVQSDIDAYMQTGEIKYLKKMNECGHCLPYTSIVKWCYENKTIVKGVFAIDENRAGIVLKRALCYDTRNKSMTNKIFEIQKENPDVPVIFYGGQLHCLQSGRYIFDRENREPIGSRLLKSFSKDEVSTLIFTANKRFVSYEAWREKTGVFPINEQTKNLERRYFIHEPVTGSKQCGDFINYFINIGDLN